MISNIINDHLKTIYNKDNLLNRAINYALNNGGKRVRPMLFSLILKGYNVDFNDYLNIASSIEMIHTYSLIHDDLPAMDNDDLRRGIPTTHIMYGDANAILAGDALLTDAFKQITKSNLDAEKRVLLIDILSEKSGSLGMVLGQVIDIEKHTKDDLELITKLKTCCLIEASMMMASVIGNYSDIKLWEEIGYKIGLAYQIQDDLLEKTSTTLELGKSVNSDENNDKITFASIYNEKKAKEIIVQLFNEAINLINQISNNNQYNFDELIDFLKNLIIRRY